MNLFILLRDLQLVVASLAAGVVLGLMNSYRRVDGQPGPFGHLISFTKSI
jgi:hypothetical protein